MCRRTLYSANLWKDVRHAVYRASWLGDKLLVSDIIVAYATAATAAGVGGKA
jgi:hypothetical protein